jgi:predicted phage terminase large subunit-like protein
VLSGGHYDVIKNDDLVDKENCRTPQQIEDVKYHFGMMTPLLETSEQAPFHGWIDVAGTRYDYSDLYGAIISTEAKRKEQQQKPEYAVVERSAAPNWPDPKGPFLWPERMGYQALKDIEMSETAGPSVLFPQYLMKPIVVGEGLITDEGQIKWVPRRIISELQPRYSLCAALDLAGMDTGALGLDNDYSALAVGGFHADGRLDIIDLWHGRCDVFTVIEWIFQVFERYPRLTKLKMEKEAHARTLLPFLMREQSRRNKWLPIVAESRDNQQSKKQKIRGLQPWFANGGIRFAEDLGSKSHILAEIKGFPKYKHDDILDCCVDIMLERDGAVSDVMGRNFGEDDDMTPHRDFKKLMADAAFGPHGRDESGAVSALTGM